RVGGKFCRTGIHALVHRTHAQLLTVLTEGFFSNAQQSGQTGIGETFALQTINTVSIQRPQAALGHRGFFFDQVFSLHPEPGTQGSNGECSYSSCKLIPRRKASPMYQIRSERGVRISEITLSLLAGSFRSTFGSKPVEPTSRPRRAFCRDSCCVRPIAITSPTDFIWVVRRPSACGNFSKVKRGILVTT